jgi:hypothetical protein
MEGEDIAGVDGEWEGLIVVHQELGEEVAAVGFMEDGGNGGWGMEVGADGAEQVIETGSWGEGGEGFDFAAEGIAEGVGGFGGAAEGGGEDAAGAEAAVAEEVGGGGGVAASLGVELAFGVEGASGGVLGDGEGVADEDELHGSTSSWKVERLKG